MSRIQSLAIGGLKASDRTVDLDQRNLLLGPVGSGKTSVEDAIAFLALGYVPRLGKALQTTARLLRDGERRLEVKATLDDRRTIRRALVLVGKSLTLEAEASWVSVDESVTTHANAITDLFGATPLAAEQHVDIRSLITATPNERARHVSAMLDATGMTPAVALRWALALTTLRVAEHERIPDTIERTEALAEPLYQTLEPATQKAIDQVRQLLGELVRDNTSDEALAKIKAAKSEATKAAREKTAARKEIETARAAASGAESALPQLEAAERAARDRLSRSAEKIEAHQRLAGARTSTSVLLEALRAQVPEAQEALSASLERLTVDLPGMIEAEDRLALELSEIVDPDEIASPVPVAVSQEAISEAQRIDAEAAAMVRPTDAESALDAKRVRLAGEIAAIVIPQPVTTSNEAYRLEVAEAELESAMGSHWRIVEAIADKIARSFPEDAATLRALAAKEGNTIQALTAARDQRAHELEEAKAAESRVASEIEAATKRHGALTLEMRSVIADRDALSGRRILEKNAKHQAAFNIRSAAVNAANAANTMAQGAHAQRVGERRKILDANAAARSAIRTKIATSEAKRRSLEMEARGAQERVDKIEADAKEAAARLAGLEASGIDVDAVKAEFRAAEAEVASLAPRLAEARRQAAQKAEMDRLIDEIERAQAWSVAISAAEWASTTVRNMDLAARAGGLEVGMRLFLAGAGRSESPYLRAGKGLCDFGWRRGTSEISIEALSGGEFALIATALAVASLDLRRPPLRILSVEAAELGSGEPFYALLRGIEAMASVIDQAFVATNANVREPETWNAIRFGEVREEVAA